MAKAPSARAAGDRGDDGSECGAGLRDGEHDDLLRSSVDGLRHARDRRYPFAIRPPPVPLEFRILGPLEVLGPDGPVSLGGPRQRAVLAILLLNANRVVSIDRLADELYGGEPPATAVTQVQRQVSDLRKLLGPVIETRPPGYLVRAGARRARPEPLRAARGGGRVRPHPRRARARSRAAARGACALARAAARRPRLRAVRRGAGRAPGGAPARRASSSASRPSWRSASTAG